MNEYIDLGCGLDSPASPMSGKPPEKSYPTFSFTCDEGIDLPDGEFMFSAKGRKVDVSANTRDPKNPRHRYEIEVHGFKPMGGAKKGPPDLGGAFKKNMDAKMAKKMGADEADSNEEMD